MDLGRESPDVLIGIQDVIGTDGNDVIVGNDLPNRVYGFGGDDLIVTRGGDDEVDVTFTGRSARMHVRCSVLFGAQERRNGCRVAVTLSAHGRVLAAVRCTSAATTSS